MNEADWLSSTDPVAMLTFLLDTHPRSGQPHAGRPSDRKLRLFACECYARVFYASHEVQPIVEAVRRWADGEISREAAIATQAPGMGTSSREGWYLFREVGECLHSVMQLRLYPPHTRADWAALLREIVGNPFLSAYVKDGHASDELRRSSRFRVARNACLDHRCLTPTVLSLASVAYHERNADGTLDAVCLLILADALEEAGCDSDDLLWHLRGDALSNPHRPSPHVRGCWVLDIILGRN